MTITRDGIATSPTSGSGVTSLAHSLGTLTAGHLVTVKLATVGDAKTFADGDLTKTAGTATIGAITLSGQVGGNNGDGGYTYAVEWSFIVTGTGTCTVTVAGLPSGSYPTLAHESYTSDIGWDSARVEDTAGTYSATDGASALSSGDATSAGAALFSATLALNNGAAVTVGTPSGFSAIVDNGSSGATVEVIATADDIVTTGTTQAAAWTYSALDGSTYNGQAALLVVYKEAAPSFTLDQSGARFGADDGSESAHTWLASQGADLTRTLGSAFLYRALLQWDGDGSAITPVLRAQKNGSGGYQVVPVGATAVSAATYFGGASGGTNPTTSTTITIPSSLPTTCVLCLHFTSRDHTSGTGQPTVTDNNSGASWTQRQNSTDRKAQWWWKRYEANLSGKTITISGAVGSLSARLVVIENAYGTGDPFTDFAEEANASGNETHAAITPTNASSAVVFAVYNYANDNAVSSVSAATSGAPGQSTGHLSTGGSDCATHVAVWNNHPASSSGSITWAQTNGTTYSHVYAVRPAEAANELYVSASANITAGGESTTSRLSGGTGTFLTGRRWDDENGSDALGDPSADQNTEVEWSLNTQAPATDGDYWDFRVYNGSSALDSYTDEIRLTIGTPTTPSLPMPQSLLQRIPALLRF